MRIQDPWIRLWTIDSYYDQYWYHLLDLYLGLMSPHPNWFLNGLRLVNLLDKSQNLHPRFLDHKTPINFLNPLIIFQIISFGWVGSWVVIDVALHKSSVRRRNRLLLNPFYNHRGSQIQLIVVPKSTVLRILTKVDFPSLPKIKLNFTFGFCCGLGIILLSC